MSAPKMVRSVANGNVLPADEVHQGLIDAGIYVPVDEEAEARAAAEKPTAEPETNVVFTPAPALEAALVQPEAEIMTTAHLTPPKKARKQVRRRKAK
jgi:hypothetical protein